VLGAIEDSIRLASLIWTATHADPVESSPGRPPQLAFDARLKAWRAQAGPIPGSLWSKINEIVPPCAAFQVSGCECADIDDGHVCLPF